MSIDVERYRELAAAEMTEKQLQAEVESIARGLNFLVYHTFDSRRSAAGFPDLVLVRPTKAYDNQLPDPPALIFVELKSEKGKVKAEQQAWMDALRDVAASATIGLHYRWGLFAPMYRPIRCVLWRPSDLINGTIHRVLEAT